MASISDISLYRIIGFDGFMSLLINKEERYVRPIDCWPDTFEGYMLHQLDSSEGMKKVLDKFYTLARSNVDITIIGLSKLLRCRYACYGQCWSKVRDSDAMWRIYSYDSKAIQLITNTDRIQRMLNASAWPLLSKKISEVEYDIKDENEALNKLLVPTAHIDSAYFHKRPAFKHEEEVRVLLNDMQKYNSVDALNAKSIRFNMKSVDKTKPIPEQIHEAVIITANSKSGMKFSAPSEIKLKIPDMKDYLEGIRVHPFAPDWYVNLVKTICRNYRVTFFGKSDLYRKTL